MRTFIATLRVVGDTPSHLPPLLLVKSNGDASITAAQRARPGSDAHAEHLSTLRCAQATRSARQLPQSAHTRRRDRSCRIAIVSGRAAYVNFLHTVGLCEQRERLVVHATARDDVQAGARARGVLAEPLASGDRSTIALATQDSIDLVN